MKTILLAMIALAGASATAQRVVCISEDGSRAIVYDADKMTMDIGAASVDGIASPGPQRIVGDTPDRPGDPRSITTVFTYRLADGREVEITWRNGSSEVNPSVPGAPESATVKGGAGAGSYPTCSWGR